MSSTYHVIYKTTNNLNNKIYVGYHSTDNLSDDYLGSGKILNEAINKYGIQNFSKEILYVFPTKEEALEKEKEIVNMEFLQRKDVYNLKIGGEGGWDYINNVLKENKEYNLSLSKKLSDAAFKNHKEGKIKGWGAINSEKQSSWNRGKPKSDSTRKKMSEVRLTKISNGEITYNILDCETIKSRINDFNNIEKTYGWVTKLSVKWGISHTQVRRFINKNIQREVD